MKEHARVLEGSLQGEMTLELRLERGEMACKAERSQLLVLRLSSGGTMSSF